MIAAINMNASVDKLYLVENWEAGADKKYPRKSWAGFQVKRLYAEKAEQKTTEESFRKTSKFNAARNS